jgi:hypothetical protein
LFLSQEGGYEGEVVDLHQNLGIATAVFVTFLYIFQTKTIPFFSRYAERNSIRITSFLTMIVLLTFTGHFGANLTHGADYLLEYISFEKEINDPAVKLQAIQDVDSAVLYADVIEPILNSRCYSCHSSRRQKGELRLDGVSFIKSGGKHGSIIESGIPDSSSLYTRLMLPLEDEHHMPPNEKPQPSSAEIALMKTWIEDGASFDKTVGGYAQASKIKSYYQLLMAQSNKQNLIPLKEVDQADDNIVRQLKSRGLLALPVSAGSNYLYVSFQNVKTATEGDLQLLLKLKSQLVWLNLGGAPVSESGMKVIAKLSELRKLSLDRTAVSDEGINAISASLSELTYLNLVGTKITDAGLMHLGRLKKLKDLYIYQTNVTAGGIAKFKAAVPFVGLDTGGYQLPKIESDSAVMKSKS